jgi:predicted transcriptional regulator
MIEEFSITIKKIKKPKVSDLNQDIQIISQSLGLFTKRDKERSCFRVFVEILKNKKGLTAEEITLNTNLTRATVIHHLNYLMKAGLIIKKGHRYCLRCESLEKLIHDIDKDINKALTDLNQLARNIDKQL